MIRIYINPKLFSYRISPNTKLNILENTAPIRTTMIPNGIKLIAHEQNIIINTSLIKIPQQDKIFCRKSSLTNITFIDSS